jgi:hypothetical protein
MWTPFVWLSEGVTNLYEGIAVPNYLRYLRGTPLLPVALNLLAATSARLYLDTTDITEFDYVHIGDHSELERPGLPANHLFRRPRDEDRPRAHRPARDHEPQRGAVQRGVVTTPSWAR